MTSLPHRAKKSSGPSETLLESPRPLAVVAKLPLPSAVRATGFLATKGLLFTLAADGGLLRHAVKPSGAATADARLKQGLFPHVGEVPASAAGCAFASDCSCVFLTGSSGLRCVDVASGAEKWRLGEKVTMAVGNDGKKQTSCLALAEDGVTLAVADEDNCVAVVALGEKGEPRVTHVLRGHDGRVTCVAVASRMNLVVTASEDGSGGDGGRD